VVFRWTQGVELRRCPVTLTQSDVGELRGRPDALTRQPNPALRDAVGVGVDIVSTLLIAAGDKRTSDRC
jgi:hypothetical protein